MAKVIEIEEGLYKVKCTQKISHGQLVKETRNLKMLRKQCSLSKCWTALFVVH